MRCHLQISSYWFDLMSVNGPISPKQCYYEMDYSFYSFYWLDSLEIWLDHNSTYYRSLSKNFDVKRYISHCENLQYKWHPEFWPSHRRISRRVYYKTRLILETRRYIKFLSWKHADYFFYLKKKYVELTRPKIELCDPILFASTRARSQVSENDWLFQHGSEFGPKSEILVSSRVQTRPRPENGLELSQHRGGCHRPNFFNVCIMFHEAINYISKNCIYFFDTTCCACSNSIAIDLITMKDRYCLRAVPQGVVTSSGPGNHNTSHKEKQWYCYV